MSTLSPSTSPIVPKIESSKNYIIVWDGAIILSLAPILMCLIAIMMYYLNMECAQINQCGGLLPRIRRFFNALLLLILNTEQDDEAHPAAPILQEDNTIMQVIETRNLE